jgi:hypothetical protein
MNSEVIIKRKKKFNETIQEAEPLIKRRIFNNELKDLQKEIDDLLGREKQKKTRAAPIGSLVKTNSASQICGRGRRQLSDNRLFLNFETTRICI